MTLTFVVVFVVLWLAQMGLTYAQARRFLRAVAELRAHGDTSIGCYRRRGLRTFAAIAVRDGRIVDSRVLRGFTVFAVPRAEPLLVGVRLADVVERPVLGLAPRTAQAVAHAVSLYRAPTSTVTTRPTGRPAATTGPSPTVSTSTA